MDLTPTIKAAQRAVGVDADGVAGPLTWAAILRALPGPPIHADPPDIVTQSDSPLADPRSEGFIGGLKEPVRPRARQFLALLSANHIDAKIISGYRTYSEQSALYWRYKNGGPQAAPPGYSNHNFALAFDIGIFEDGKYLEESPLYRMAGQLSKYAGLMWGGDWKNQDEPHYEFRPDWAKNMTEGQALSEYRERLQKGLEVV